LGSEITQLIYAVLRTLYVLYPLPSYPDWGGGGTQRGTEREREREFVASGLYYMTSSNTLLGLQKPKWYRLILGMVDKETNFRNNLMKQARSNVTSYINNKPGLVCKRQPWASANSKYTAPYGVQYSLPISPTSPLSTGSHSSTAGIHRRPWYSHCLRWS
jgi:hypothetical protein